MLHLDILHGDSSKQGCRRQQSQGLIEDSCSIWELVQLLIAWLLPLELIHLMQQLLLRFWVVAEQVDTVGERHRSGLIACQHEGRYLRSDLPANNTPASAAGTTKLFYKSFWPQPSTMQRHDYSEWSAGGAQAAHMC